MDKKISAKDAALAVLAKAREMYKASNLAKADPLGTNPAAARMQRAAGYKERGDKVSHEIAVQGAKESHKEKLESIKSQPKPKLTKAEAIAAQLAKGEGKHTDNHAYNFDDMQSVKGVNKVLPKYDRATKKLSHGGSESNWGNKKETKINAHKNTLAELKAMPKPNLTKSGDATIAMSESKDQTPAQGVQSQPAPESNPAEKQENSNPPWGTEPGSYKLAKFMGRREERKKAKAPAPAAPAAPKVAGK